MAKKVLKIIFFIISIIIIILLIHTIKNTVIITSLQKKVNEYVDSTNYHVKFVTNEKNGTVLTGNYYRKENKEVTFLERNINGEITKISIYEENGKVDYFIENSKEKIAKLNTNFAGAEVNIVNYLETYNIGETILSGFTSSIIETKHNEKYCYKIKKSMFNFKEDVYIERDTGLLFSINQDGVISNREYEFNCVDDNIFIEPDISNYIVK